MCFSPEEKKEIFGRLRAVEHKADEHETTMKVALGVSSAFMGILIIISIWYLNMREQEMHTITQEIQSIGQSIIRMETGQQIYQEAFSGHLSDPDNHPDNTDRVNRLVDDVRELRREFNQNH